jgi:large subunit ribosomal protein L14
MRIIMIRVGTQLQVSDNSGAKLVECIKVLNKLQVASIGDFILISVKQTLSKQKTKVDRGGIYKALVVETRQGIQRKDGTRLKFGRNSVVLFSVQGNPLGTRIHGCVTYELRRIQEAKILSLASTVL